MPPTTTVPTRALITGGAGFIGSHLADALLAENVEVYALDDFSTGNQRNVRHLESHPHFHLVPGSVLSESLVAELVLKCDEVYHLAAAVGVRLIVEQPVETLRTNVRGTENVLDCCARYKTPVFIASTSEVYGDHRISEPLAEASRRIYGPTTSRRWAYADSKALDELLALAYRDELGLQCIIGRLFNTVGPRQTGEYGMVIPRFVGAALAGEPLVIFGDGSQTRCFAHVADVVDVVRRLTLGRHYGEIVNIGATTPTSIIDLAELVISVTQSKSPLQFLPHSEAYGMGIEDMLHRQPDISKVAELTGWRPRRTLDQILSDVVSHLTASP